MLGVLDVVLWSLRKSPGDVVRMYERLSPLMCGITGGSMLNFGYWDCAHGTPALAQDNMCRLVADAAELSAAATGRLTVLDVGSGLCAPAMYWARHYSGMDVFCVNTSYGQLHEAAHLLGRGRAADRNNNNGDDVDRDGDSSGNSYKHGGGDGHGSSGGLSCGSIDPVNASAVALPFAAGSADRSGAGTGSETVMGQRCWNIRFVLSRLNKMNDWCLRLAGFPVAFCGARP